MRVRWVGLVSKEVDQHYTIFCANFHDILLFLNKNREKINK